MTMSTLMNDGRGIAGIVCFSSVLLAGVMVTGCGDGYAERAPVTGRITYKGNILEIGQIIFIPEKGRPAFGKIRDSEIVDVTTFKKGDGVYLGEAAVGIKCVTNMDSIEGPHKPMIPERYFDPETSGLRYTVKEGEPNRLTLDLED